MVTLDTQPICVMLKPCKATVINTTVWILNTVVLLQITINKTRDKVDDWDTETNDDYTNTDDAVAADGGGGSVQGCDEDSEEEGKMEKDNNQNSETRT